MEPQNLLCLTLLLWTRPMSGLADFSNYLSRIIVSHSAGACDGQPLRLHCPRHSTISIQSAFYGGGSGASLCGGAPPPGAPPPGAPPHGAPPHGAHNHSCSALTALQKLLSECQSRRDCQLPVHHLLFGEDPCPGASKHLHVDYKCKPTEHKRHVACDGGEMILRCKPRRVLNIYAAVYGRSVGRTDTCPSHLTRPPPFGESSPFSLECLNHEAVHLVSRSCYGKQRCIVSVSNQTFRDPCFPGTRKYLSVLYSCVPQALLREADPYIMFSSTSYPTVDTEKAAPADVEEPSSEGSRRPVNSGAVMSNSLLIYAYIREHPERAALLFASSVCVGLLLTLLAVSVRVTRRGQRLGHHRPAPRARSQVAHCKQDDDDTDEEEGTESSLISAAEREATCASEAAERAVRIERREMVMQEIWMNAYLNGSAC